jgi:hypothetical protein
LSTEQRIEGVEAGTGRGDVSGEAFLGCIAGGAGGNGTNGCLSAGVCRAATTTPPEEPGDDSGGGVAGEQASGRSSPRGVLGALASGELPFTGLPLWAIALAGLALTGLGVYLRRLHPPALDVET